MTLRGRLTLAVAAALAGWAASSLLAGRDPEAATGWVSPRPVGAAADDRGDAIAVPASLLSRVPAEAEGLERVEAASSPLDLPGPYYVESMDLPADARGLRGPLRVEYAMDAELTERILRVLSRARVRRGHVIVLDPESGRVLTYVSTDPESFPPDQTYPAASLVKIVTAAAALHRDPSAVDRPCRYTGNPYRLRRSQIHPPRRGREVSLERALAMSNNHCFAQLAVHAVGGDALLGALRRFGWLEEPAPGHAAGRASVGDDEYDLGRLGCGLAGCRITPLHAVQLAATLAHGERVEPWWIHRVTDADGRELALPRPGPRRRVMTERLADELRGMLVRTTTRGTARRAFLNRRGRPLLDDVHVAGKTGNLTGSEPRGRYEWFAGVAPADDPSVAVAVVQLHDDLWWQNSASLAAGVLQQIFCERNRCSAERAQRFTGTVEREVTPLLLSSNRH
jgi:cell division protein FtsI/penicillin-binding protein 2